MYLLYFVLFGAFIPYIARFLTDNGLSAQEASWIIAVVNGVNVFAPFLFSVLADRTGRRMTFIRIGYAAIGTFYFTTYFYSGFWFYLVTLGLFGVFLSAVLPQMEAISLSVLGKDRYRYGQIRLWGSIGFVLSVWGCGLLIDRYSVQILPLLGSGLSLLMFASTYLIPERKIANRTDLTPPVDRQFQSSIQWGQVAILLLVVLCWQFGMAPYNTFFDLYMRANGYSSATNGLLISFGSLCEIAVFIYISRLFSHYTERQLMSFALFMTVIRWLMLGNFGNQLWMVLFTQSIHALTFGLVHSVVVHRIGRLFPENRASFGQGLYVAIGAGVGLFIGNLLAGMYWDGTGIIYIQSAGWAFIALLVTWFGFRDLTSPVAIKKP